MEMKQYRLNSPEEPTDEMLYTIMEQVEVAARENSLRAKKELARRMHLLDKAIDDFIAGTGKNN